MKTIDILNKKFTIMPNPTGYTKTNGYIQINQTLKWIIELGYKYREPIDRLREMEYHSEEQKKFKSKFPCWFVGGTFPLGKIEDKDILDYSNVLAIDIDKKDNPTLDIENLSKTLFELPYVIMISKSISGQGIYVLLLIEDGRYTKEYYNYIDKLWHSKYNIEIDHQCKNIGRRRFLSYDDDLLIKDNDIDIEPWKLRLKEQTTIKETKPIINCSKYVNTNDNIELTHKAIWYLLNNGYSIDNINCSEKYGVWYHIGCDFRHFDDGEDMFIKFSNNSCKYNDTITNIQKKWNNTKIENNINEVSRKWCGICKRIYGSKWISMVKTK